MNKKTDRVLSHRLDYMHNHESRKRLGAEARCDSCLLPGEITPPAAPPPPESGDTPGSLAMMNPVDLDDSLVELVPHLPHPARGR